MDTSPQPSETINSTSIGSGGVELGSIEDKDAEMRQLEQNSADCNNMNNKRVRQIVSNVPVPTTAETAVLSAHRSSVAFGLLGTGSHLTSTEASDIRDHRMSVSDSGDSEPPRPSDLDNEPIVSTNVVPSGTTETVSPSGRGGASVVSSTEVLESDGDVRTDDDEVRIVLCTS